MRDWKVPSGAPKPACHYCPGQGGWLEPASPPAWQGFRLHAVHGSCVAQLGFSKGVIKPRFFPCNSDRIWTEAMPRASREVQTGSTPENHCSSMHLHCAETKPSPGHCGPQSRCFSLASRWTWFRARGWLLWGQLCTGLWHSPTVLLATCLDFPPSPVLCRAISPPRITGALPPSATRALLQPVPAW